MSNDVDVQMGTMSKALGTSGGYVCGSHDLIEWLINRARSFIYSTAPPPAIAAAALAAVNFLSSSEGEERRLLLWERINLMRQLLLQLSIECWTPARDLPEFDARLRAANAQRPTPKVFASKALNAQRSMYPRARSFRCSLAMSRRRLIWPLHSKPKDSSSRRFVIRRWQKAQRVCALR